MKWLRLKIWLIRYTIEFRRRTGWSFSQSWDYGESSIENVDRNLEDLDCPIDYVDEDLSCWSD